MTRAVILVLLGSFFLDAALGDRPRGRATSAALHGVHASVAAEERVTAEAPASVAPEGQRKKGTSTLILSPGTAWWSPKDRKRRRKNSQKEGGAKAVLAAVQEGVSVVAHGSAGGQETERQRQSANHGSNASLVDTTTQHLHRTGVRKDGQKDGEAVALELKQNQTDIASRMVTDLEDGHSDDGAHGPVDKVDQALGTCMGWMLVGFLLLGMGGVYTLTYPDDQVRSYASKAAFQIVSIFCALLYVMIQDAIVLRAVHEILGIHFVPFAVMFLFIFWYCAMSYICVYGWGDHDDDHAIQGTVSHICAFTALHPLEHAVEHWAEHIEEEHGFGGAALTYFIAPSVILATMWMLRGVSVRWRTKNSQDHHKLESASEAESETTAILTGYLWCQFVVCIATAQIPPHDCHLHFCNHSPHSAGMMSFFIIVGIYGLVSVSAYNAKFGDEHNDAELIDLVQPISAFFLSFLFLTLGGFFMEKGIPGGMAGGAVVHAAMFTPLIVLAIIVIDRLADMNKIEDGTAEAVLMSLGLLIGLQWEMAFHAGLHVAVSSVDIVPPMVLESALAILLVAALVPAWRWYLVPIARLPVPKRNGKGGGDGGHGGGHGEVPSSHGGAAEHGAAAAGADAGAEAGAAAQAEAVAAPGEAAEVVGGPASGA